jgi:hypothetical protein
MRENRVRSLAEVGGSWRSEPVFEFDPGSRWWAAHCLYEHEVPTLSIPVRFLRATAFVVVSCIGRVFAMDEVDDADLVVERVAALDLGKAGLEACVRVPHPQRPSRRMQELRGYATATAQLLAMAAWLRHTGTCSGW